jgi:cAMP phosphodiesterase
LRIELLKSTAACDAVISKRQHLTCFVINDRVAIDAGSLAQSCSDSQRENIRDVVLTHAHLDHIAGLPIFVDDLFSSLTSPIKVHACQEVIEDLEKHIFNWSIYPRFSELSNENGPVLEYCPLVNGRKSDVCELHLIPIPVNHKVPSSGFLISDDKVSIAFSGDTSEMDDFWAVVNVAGKLNALFIECAFPNSLTELADASHHLTPRKLRLELMKFKQRATPIFVINMKPMFRETIKAELSELKLSNIQVLDPGRVYEF